MRNYNNIPKLLSDGEGKNDWIAKRAELCKMIEEIEYGKRPDIPYQVKGFVRSEDTYPTEEIIRRVIDIQISTELGTHSFPIYLFIPVGKIEVPATLLICSQSRVVKPMKLPEGFSFDGIQKMFETMEIIMDGPFDAGTSSKGLDMAVDMDNGHWPVPEIMKRNHAGFYATDAEADGEDFLGGIAEIFGTKKNNRQSNEWGVIAIWAFAAQCVMDYLQTIPELDVKRIGITGHSRCGKAALWAAVKDERFAWVMPNNSGCCGAALLREKHGENIRSITAMMPYWFAPGFSNYVGRLEELPFDQHMLLALIAPRILHVASGSEDYWADPQGEHISTVMANEVYQLYGNPIMENIFPKENTAILAGSIGYHLRKGPHLLTEYDWMQLLDHVEKVI